MSLVEAKQTTDYTFIDYWIKSGGEIVSHHKQKFKNERSSNPKELHLRTTQIHGIQQGNGDQSCGYYGIFFISKLSQIFSHLSKSENQTIDSITRLMQDLRSKEAFASFKSEIINELLVECKKRNINSYPWLEDHITSGVLERIYLQFLQNNYFRKNRLQMVHNDSDIDEGYPPRYDVDAIAKKYGFRYLFDSINLMEFSESALKTNHLPLLTMDHLEYFFNEKFAKNIENYKIFLIGSAIHYVVAAIYKNPNGNIDLLYIDPQNNNILFKDKCYLWHKIICEMKFESWLKYGWKLADMRKLAMDSFRGIQFAVNDLITNTIYNLYSSQYNKYFIRDKLIKININKGFLGGFKAHVLLPMVRTISNESEVKNDEVDSVDSGPQTGLFVGVNKDFEIKDEKTEQDDDENSLDANQWKKECEFVMTVIGEKLRDIELAKNKNKNKNDDLIEKHISDIKTCSAFAKLWISTYYPSAVIDQNIVNVVNKLECDSYIPNIVLSSLNIWSSLMMVFANAQNRKLVQIQDDKFWRRLASTLLVVQLVTQTDTALTKL